MEFLFKYNFIIVHIGRVTMMFEIVLDHLIRNISRTPCAISYGPKMATPISLGKGREFFLQSTGSPSFEPFYKIADLLGGTVLDMHVHMVPAYHSLKNSNIFRITYLLDQITAPHLYIPLKYRISIFCDPHYMDRQPRYRMTRSPLFISHSTNIEKCVATESLALKCIVSTNDCDQ